MKKSLLISLIILFVLPIQIFAGLDIISDFEVVSGDEWENTYINGPAYLTNFVVTADRFQGSGCIEFKGDYISNWGGAEGGWKLILPSQQSWSNYSKFIFSMKIISIFTDTVGKPAWQWNNENLNYGFAVKEFYGDPQWCGETWEYYITNHPLIWDRWYLFERDMSFWDGKTNIWWSGWDYRFNTFHDTTWDSNYNNNVFPPRQAVEIDLFYKTGLDDYLVNQRIRLDFMAIISTPYAKAQDQTNYFPMNLQWKDVAPNHPVYQIQIVTNNTNANSVIDTIIGSAENISNYSFDAYNYNVKPYKKYFWKTRSGYIVNTSNGFLSGSYIKWNLDKTTNTIPGNSSYTLWSYYSAWAEFTNNGIKPFNTAHFIPADNSSNFGLASMDFQWEDLKEEGADVYRIIISTNYGSRVIDTQTTSLTNFTLNGVTNYFEASSNYYYSITSGYTDYYGTQRWDRSVTNKFTFYYVAPTLTDPINNETIYSGSYTFIWANAFDGVNYTLEIASDQNFATILTQTSGVKLSSALISFNPDKFDNEKNYYWHVISACGIGTLYSTTNAFYLNVLDWAGRTSGDVPSKIYPTILTGSDELRVFVENRSGKDLERVKVVILDPQQNMVFNKQYLAFELPSNRVVKLSLSDLGLDKGFYLAYTIATYSDNTVSRSDAFPVIIK